MPKLKDWMGRKKHSNEDRLRQKTESRQHMREQAVARFQDGPLHGQEMAVPSHDAPIAVSYTTTPVSVTGAMDAWSANIDVNSGYYYTSADWAATAASAFTPHASNITWHAEGTGSGNHRYYVWENNGTDPYRPSEWLNTAAATPLIWQEYQQEPLTQEEADRRLAAARATQHKSAIRRKKAIKRGRKLLLEVLTDDQRVEYAKTRSFTVMGQDGRRYRLRKSGTTHELDVNGQALYSHCIHLPYSYIDEDTLVAIKLILETDVQEFRRIANTSTISIPHMPASMEERSAALRSGVQGVAQHFRRLTEAAEEARRSVDRLGHAIQYAGYVRELEHQLVAEETSGLLLPLAARQQYTARALGLAEDIAGVAVAA